MFIYLVGSKSLAWLCPVGVSLQGHYTHRTVKLTIFGEGMQSTFIELACVSRVESRYTKYDCSKSWLQ